MNEAIVQCAALAIVFVACLERIRVFSKLHGHCEIWGYSILLGGVVASIAEWFMPRADLRGETITAIGMALISLSVLRPYVRGLLARLRGRWDGIERRATPRTSTDRFGRTE